MSLYSHISIHCQSNRTATTQPLSRQSRLHSPHTWCRVRLTITILRYIEFPAPRFGHLENVLLRHIRTHCHQNTNTSQSTLIVRRENRVSVGPSRGAVLFGLRGDDSLSPSQRTVSRLHFTKATHWYDSPSRCSA